MNHYRIETETEGREVYDVTAPDEATARKLVADGDAGRPSISEVTGGSIENVELVAEDVGDTSSQGDPGGQKRLGPFVAESETSRKAALDAYPRQDSQRRRVLLAVAQAPATRENLAERLHLSENTIRPRVRELIVGGWIEESGATRKTTRGSEANVLDVTQKAVEYAYAMRRGAAHAR